MYAHRYKTWSEGAGLPEMSAPLARLPDGLSLPEDFPEQILEHNGSPEIASGKYHGSVQDFKKRLILNAIRESGGKYADAAKALGLHPNYLHRLIRNLNIKGEIEGGVSLRA